MSRPSPQPFRLNIPDETLQDLRERLTRVRWPGEPPQTGKMPPREWCEAKTQFAIMFDDRFVQA